MPRRPTTSSWPSSRDSRRTRGSSPRPAVARWWPLRRVAAMSLGRLDEETTANVGMIRAARHQRGCRPMPDRGRGPEPRRGEGGEGDRGDVRRLHLGRQRARVRRRCRGQGVFRGYRLPSEPPALQLARTALERRGVEPREAVTGGGSDANAFDAAGFDGAARQRDRGEHTPRSRNGRADRPDVRLGGDVGGGGRMLKLRRGGWSNRPLTVKIGGEQRPAWADPGLVGDVAGGTRCREHRGASIWAGIGRVRRRAREPVPRARGGGVDRRDPRDEAQLHSLQHPIEPGRGAAR